MHQYGHWRTGLIPIWERGHYELGGGHLWSCKTADERTYFFHATTPFLALTYRNLFRCAYFHFFFKRNLSLDSPCHHALVHNSPQISHYFSLLWLLATGSPLFVNSNRTKLIVVRALLQIYEDKKSPPPPPPPAVAAAVTITTHQLAGYLANSLTLSRGRRAGSDFGHEKASSQNFIHESIQKFAQTLYVWPEVLLKRIIKKSNKSNTRWTRVPDTRKQQSIGEPQ